MTDGKKNHIYALFYNVYEKQMGIKSRQEGFADEASVVHKDEYRYPPGPSCSKAV